VTTLEGNTIQEEAPGGPDPRFPAPPTRPASPGEEPSPFAVLLAERQAIQDQLLARSLAIAPDADPEKVGEAQRIGAKLGVDPTQIERGLETFRQRLVRSELARWQRLGRLPHLQRQMIDPAFARVAYDDLESLGALERLGEAWDRGAFQVELGKLETKRRDQGLTPAETVRADAISRYLDATPLPGGFFRGAAEILGQLASTLPEVVETGLATGLAAGGTALIAGQAGPQMFVPEEAFTVPFATTAGFFAGATARLLQQSYETEGGLLYRDILREGIDPTVAAWVSRFGGAVNAALEVVGAGAVAGAAGIAIAPVRRALFRELARGTAEALRRPTTAEAAREFAKRYLQGHVGEVMPEGVQEVVSILAEDLARGIEGQQLTLLTPEGQRAAIARVADIVAKTAQGMALLALPGPTVRFVAEARRARRVQEDVAAFEAWTGAIERGKVKARNPDQVEAFGSRTLAGKRMETAYISADRFTDALAQTNLSREELERDLPDVAEQLDGALATGGDVVIPTARYGARIVGTPLDAALREHIRFDPDGYSAAEAQEVQEAQKALAEQAQQAVEDAPTFSESGRAVEEAFRQQVLAAGRGISQRQARDTAATLRASVETIAAELSLTPDQFAERFGVKVVRGEGTPAAEAMTQQRRAAFEPRTGEIALFEGAGVDSVLHEMSHAFLHWHGEIAAMPDAPVRVVGIMDDFLRWRGIEGGAAAWRAMSREEQREHHEAFATAFEDYAATGVAPSLELQSAFGRFRRWIVALWRNLRRQAQEVPAEVRAIFDRMLASDEAIAHAEAVRGLVPMFHVKPETWSEAQWERYQQHLDDATEAAVAEVQARSLRDMQWLSRAGGRKVRELQRQHDEIRDEVREEIRREVEAEPVYRALRFIRKGELVDATGTVQPYEGTHKLHTESVRELISPAPRKPTRIADMELTDAIAALGGINRQQALAIGIDPAEVNARRNVGGQLRYVFPKKGRTLDEIREALEEEGFRFADVAELSKQILNSLFGQQVLSERKEFSEEEVEGAFQEFEATREPGATPAPRTTDLRTLGITTPKGLLPDQVAEMFGFGSGESLVRALITAPPIDEVVEARTDAHMVATYADLTDAKVVQRAVDEALHNPARARFVATELRALERGVRPTRLMVAAAREVARATLAKMPVAQIKAWRFQAAEGRARREALRAAAKGDTAAAIEAVRAELLQHEMAREAALIEREVEKAEARFRRFYKPDQKLGRTRDIDIVALGRAVLGAHTGQPTDPMALLLANERFGPETKEELAEVVSRLSENRTPYRSLPLEEFRTLVEGLDALWVRALRENQIRVAGRLEEKRRIVGILVDALSPPDRPPRPTSSITPGGRLRRSFGSVLAAIRHAESWALEQDGSTTGPVHRYLFALLREPFDAYQIEKRAFVHKVSQALRALRIDRKQKIEAPELNHTFANKRELIGTLLHAGNPSNLRKLLLGMQWTEEPANRGGPIDESPWWRFVERAMDEGLITKADMDFVQSVWDTFEELFPRSQEAHFDIYGYRAEPVEARAIVTPWGTYRGGYFRLQIDRAEAEARGIPVPPRNDDAIIETSRETRATVPSTGRGFMVSRVEVSYPPVRDIRFIASALDEELRFIHLQRPGRDVLRLLRDPVLADAINRIDPHAIDGIWMPWLRDTLQNRVMKSSGLPVVDSFLTFVRRNTGLSLMFANARVAVQQVTGLANARAYVPLGFLRNGFSRWAHNPRQTWRDVVSASQFMRTRLEDAAGQITDDADLLSGPGWLRAGQEWTRKHGHFMQRWFQVPVDIITWLGAHEQAVSEGRTPEEAVRHADAIVRRSQSSGLAPDISRYERSGALVRLLTQFNTYWLTTLNSLIEQPSPQRVALIIGLVGLTSGALVKALDGGWDDDDQDGDMWDDVASWTFAETFSTAAALVPAPFGQLLAPGPGGRISFGAAVSQAERARRGLISLATVPFSEEELTGADIRDFGALFTLLTGMPFSAAARPAGYLRDVGVGRQPEPENVARRVSGLIVGR
jgi:hypothetical protein